MELLLGFIITFGTWMISCNMSLVGLLTISVVGFYSFFFLYTQCLSVTMSSTWFIHDSVSGVMLVLVSFVVIISLYCSDKDFDLDSFDLMPCLCALGTICSFFFLSGKLVMFYFSFEASLLPTMGLILGWGYQPERVQAGFSMMLYTVLASMPLFMVVIFYSFNCFSDHMFLLNVYLSEGLSSFVWGMVLLAFLVKLPIFLVHSWLPKAHVEAPVSGSMVLAGVLLKLGGYGMWRTMCVFNFYNEALAVSILVGGLWGGLLASAVCMCQSDMKCLIAYSSIGHMSMVLGGLMSFFCLGWMSGLALMLAHGVCSPCMFSLASSTYGIFNSRSMAVCKGILMTYPGFSFFWFLMSALNMGCPPSLNFLSECFLVGSVVFTSYYFMLVLGLMCFVTAGYCLFLYCSINHGGVLWVWLTGVLNGERMLFCFIVSSWVLFFGGLNLDIWFS